jgi:hypothetical protein
VLPVATIPLQDEAALRRFHNRVLRDWPASVSAIGPVDYFKAAGGWLADRANPIIAASLLQKQILFYALHTAPQARVSLGPEGHVFLTGNSEANLNDIISPQCLAAQDSRLAGLLNQSLNSIQGFARRLGMTQRTVMFPTTPTLYADFLPPSIPRSIRDACKFVLEKGSPLAGLAGLGVTYPFAEMKALRRDPAFYPIANFHPEGYSLKIARDAYLRDEGIVLDIEESVRPVTGRSELLQRYGINKAYRRYEIMNTDVSADGGAQAALAKELTEFFYYPPQIDVWVNSSPHVSRTAIMVSDSFGGNAAPIFAAAFKRLISVNITGSRQDMRAAMLERLAGEQKLDTMILLVQEGNTGMVDELGQILKAP